MTPPIFPELIGFEYDWLASDDDGNIALFSTAGGGIAPPGFVERIGKHDHAIEVVMQTAPLAPPRCFPSVAPGLSNTWAEVASRGLFAYDSDPNGGPYRLVAVPATAIRVADVPNAVRLVVKPLVFRTLRFQETLLIDASLVGKLGA